MFKKTVIAELLLLISQALSNDYSSASDFAASKCFNLCKKDMCASIEGRAEACLRICKSTPYFSQIQLNCGNTLDSQALATPDRRQPPPPYKGAIPVLLPQPTASQPEGPLSAPPRKIERIGQDRQEMDERPLPPIPVEPSRPPLVKPTPTPNRVNPFLGESEPPSQPMNRPTVAKRIVDKPLEQRRQAPIDLNEPNPLRTNRGVPISMFEMERFPLTSDIKETLEEGNLTEASIIPLLVARKLLPSTALQQDLYQVARMKAGSFSGSIFKVSLKATNRPVRLPRAFVIKELKWGFKKVKTRQSNTPIKELQDIEYIKASNLMSFSYSVTKPTYPSIVLPVQNFYYISPTDNEKIYLSIMPMAAGDDLYSLLNQGIKESNSLQQAQNRIFYVAKALGSIHYGMASPTIKQALASPDFDFSNFVTAVHGDFHIGNVFFDDVTNRVSFIDNASFAASLRNPQHIMEDIFNFFRTLKNVSGLTPEIYNHLIYAFIGGYISAFPESVENNLQEYLTTFFKRMVHYTPPQS